ncbi:MAG: TolC family protein [Treponema sp.]|jgi:outer membrane protein TolC|nr:TolC family protein [Treponema sp.]
MQKILVILILCCLLYPVLYANEADSLTFAQAGQLAVAASADLRHARTSQSLMEGAWSWGLRAYFPRMGITVSENDRLQQIGTDSFVKNYGISLEQLVWDGGRISMSRKLERMELDIASSRLNRMAGEIAESAIAAYRNVLSSRTILEIRNSAYVVLEEQRRILNEEVNLGLALAVDLASADMNLADARIDIYSLQLDLAEMEKQFAEILGLESLPILIESVDINRQIVLPVASAAAALAREQNPDLVEARFSITKKQAELRYISNSWIPTLRLTGNFGLSGQRYPLTRHNWSVGLSIDFSTPWIQNQVGVQASWEPPHDRGAIVQNSLTPLPDPASSFSREQAALSLALEQEKYIVIHERIGRMAATAVEKCIFANQKLILSIEAATLGNERCRIEEIRLNLGHITRLRLMEVLIEQTQREIAVVQAATSLLEAERELERFLDLEPGELAEFATAISSQRRD